MITFNQKEKTLKIGDVEFTYKTDNEGGFYDSNIPVEMGKITDQIIFNTQIKMYNYIDDLLTQMSIYQPDIAVQIALIGQVFGRHADECINEYNRFLSDLIKPLGDVTITELRESGFATGVNSETKTIIVSYVKDDVNENQNEDIKEEN
jgi:hypothetical protein